MRVVIVARISYRPGGPLLYYGADDDARYCIAAFKAWSIISNIEMEVEEVTPNGLPPAATGYHGHSRLPGRLNGLFSEQKKWSPRCDDVTAGMSALLVLYAGSK